MDKKGLDNKGFDNKGFEKGQENGMEKTPSIMTFQTNENFDTPSRLKLSNGLYSEKNGKINYTSKEETYDPFSNRDKSHATSSMGAFVHMVKSSLGTGILAMPGAFKNGGLLFGVIGTLVTGFICTHCVAMMVNCSQVLSSRVKKPTLSFAETAEVSFKTGPPRYRFLASFARELINFTLFCTYFFGNTVYIIFIARTFEQVIEGHSNLGWNVRVYIVLLGFVLLPLGIIRTLKYLVPFSAIATAFISFGLAITLYYTFREIPDVSHRDFIGTPLKIPLFFSTVLFAMEGIGTVLPIENSMNKPERFLGCPGVLNGAMSVVVVLYVVVGFFGYLRFGNLTQATVTLNLPDSALAESVKILVALSVLLTYGLQFTVPSEIVWKRVGPLVSENKQEIGYYIMRGFMIVGTVIVAVMLPSLAPIISLVGAICFSILGLFCPAVIDIITFWDGGDYGKYQWKFYKNVFLIFLSIFSLVSGSYASILEIIEAMRNGEL